MQNITDRPPVEGVRWLSMGGGKELHLLAVIDGEVTQKTEAADQQKPKA